MEHALIICKSQTDAIQVCRHLEGAGIYGEIVRLPRRGSGSCAFAVGIEVWEQHVAREILYRAHMGNHPIELDGGMIM